MRTRTLALFAAAILASAASPARANDSIAELGTGGLILSRSDVIEMASEDLFISMEEVTVAYEFRNRSDSDIEAIVAFPMPELEGNPFWQPALPSAESDNFLGFEVVFDGAAVTPNLEHRAFAVGIDVTEDLVRHGVPLYPFGKPAVAALAKLPDRVAADWIERGIIVIDEFDAGQGWQRVRSPLWNLKSTYWWRGRFPAGRSVAVSHRYRPSVGGTAGVTFVQDGKLGGETHADYKARYCMDGAFERAVLKAAAASPDGYPALFEQRLSYILKTGGNWANGTIGRFRLTVDKGSPRNLVSFCGTGVRKTGPTTFVMEAQDFYPERNLDILILVGREEMRSLAPRDGAQVTRKAAKP